MCIRATSKPRLAIAAMLLAVATTLPAVSGAQSGHGGGGGSGGNSGSGGGGSSSGSGSGSSGSGSWGSRLGSSESGSGRLDSASGSGSSRWGSESGGWSGSGDTLSDLGGSNRGSGSSNSGSGSSNSGSGSSGSGSGSSNRGSGSSDSNSGKSGGGSGGEGSNGSHGNGDPWRGFALRERPDYDPQGFPVRRGELFAIDLNPAQIESVQASGFRIVDRIRLSALGMTAFRLRAPKGLPTMAALALLREGEAGASTELDHYFGVTSGEVDLTPGATMVDMKVPGRDKLWVGMIDTAVWTSATLRDVRVDAHDFASATGRSHKPPFAHGTAVASILARQGAVRLTAANVFTADQRPYASAEAIARAVNWMVGRKVPVINISIAGPRNALVDRVIAAATARGHIVVAAAGNEGPTAPPTYPAASAGALAVTAIDRAGRIYPSANRGSHIEISAFGVGIGAEAPDGTLKPHTGTSFAAPFVSAALARCLRHPELRQSSACVRSMESRARDLGVPGRDPVYGYGLLVP